MNTNPNHDGSEKEHIISYLKSLLSSRTTLTISTIESDLQKRYPYTSALLFAQDLLTYITTTNDNEHDIGNFAKKQEIDLMIVIWLNKSINQCFKLNLITELDMKKLIILYFNTIVSGKLHIKVINQISRLFQFLLNQSSSLSISNELLTNLLSCLYNKPNKTAFSLSYFTGVMQVIKIATDILIKKINTEIKQLNDIFILIERLLLDIVLIYESIAFTYIDEDYIRMTIAVTVITKLYSYFNALFKLKPDIISKIKNFIRLDIIFSVGIKIIFIKLPSKNQCFPMIWSINNQFDIELNKMKISIYKVIIQLIKDSDFIHLKKEVIQINKAVIAKNMLFFEVVINNRNSLEAIKERSSNFNTCSIYHKFISVLLDYSYTVLKTNPFDSFLLSYKKQFLFGPISQLLAIDGYDEAMTNQYPREYLRRIEHAGNELRIKQYTAKAALVLREICKEETISNYFWAYLVKSLNKKIELYGNDKENNNTSKNQSGSISNIISSQLLLCYLMPKSLKALSSIKELIAKNSLFKLANENSTPLTIKIHFGLIIKRYHIDLYDESNLNIKTLIQYLYFNINLIDYKDNKCNSILSQMSLKTIQLIYKRSNSLVNSKLISIITEELTKRTIGNWIHSIQSKSFIRIVYQIIKQPSIKSNDMMKAFKIICKTFNNDLKINKKDDDVLVNITIGIKSLKAILNKKEFITENVNEIDIEVDNELMPLIHYSSLHCCDDIIDLLLKYSAIKKDMSNAMIFEFKKLIANSLTENEEMPIRVFKIIMTFLVYNINHNTDYLNINNDNNNEDDDNNQNQYDGVINYFRRKLNKIEEGSTNAFKATMLMIALIRSDNHHLNLNGQFIIQKIIHFAIMGIISIASNRVNYKENNKTNQVTFATLIILLYSGFTYYSKETADVVNSKFSIKDMVELNSMIYISSKYIILKQLLIEGLCSMLKSSYLNEYKLFFLEYLFKLMIETKQCEAIKLMKTQIKCEEDDEKSIQYDDREEINNDSFDNSIIETSELVMMNKTINVFSLFDDIIKHLHFKDPHCISNWIQKLIENKRYKIVILFHLKKIGLIEHKHLLFNKQINAFK